MSFADATKLVVNLAKKRQSVLQKRSQGKSRTCLIEPEQTTKSGDQADDARAERLDGAFFEGFVVLQQKQHEHVEEAAKETLKREALSASHHQQEILSICTPISTDKSLELYKEIMYLIMHRLGKKAQGGDNLTDGEIYTYAKTVLNITDQQHNQTYDQVKALKAPECYLNVKVAKAEGLDAMDANGLSDPYCMLCLIRQGEGDRISDNGNKIKKNVLREFVKETDVKMTKIKMKTLNPEWNQHFKFFVDDIQNQVLRLDMWDRDDNSVVLDSENKITAIKGFKGAGRVLKELYQSAKGKQTLDDFMALVEVPLKNIPENGLTAWFQLEGRSSKRTVKGRIQLHISLSTKIRSTETSLLHRPSPRFIQKESGQPAQNLSGVNPNQLYKDILDRFARYDCKQSLEIQANGSWDCQLSPALNLILLQYTMQHEIRPLEEVVIKWEVFSRMNENVHMSMDMLRTLLENYRKHSVDDKLDTDEELAEYVDSLKSFVDYSLTLLSKFRYLYSSVDQKNTIELGKLLLCLLMIYRLPAFQAKYPEANLHKDVEAVLEKSTGEWFMIEDAFHQTMEQGGSDTLSNLSLFVNTITADLQRGIEVYQPIFKVINVRYMVVVFNKIEILISELVENKVKSVENQFSRHESQQKSRDEIAKNCFTLYFAIKDLYKMKMEHIPEDEQISEGLNSWARWFRKGVVRLFEIASEKAEARTLKALEMDEVRVIDSMVKHSTSAVDVTCCLGQICIFWNSLEWPDPLGAYTFLAQIVGIVSNCAMHYGRLVFDNLKKKGFYDDIGQFDVTDELCIMMNNATHVLQFLDYVPTAAEFEKCFDNMRQSSDQKAVDKSSETLYNILNCAKTDILNNLDHIILHVGSRMKESLKEYIYKIITNDKKSLDEACEPLMEYIDTNLVTLSTALLTQVFERVLSDMWVKFLSCVEEIATQRKLSQKQFEKLHQLLLIVREFFHGDGNGLSFTRLTSEYCQNIEKMLTLNSSTTEELIESYYVDQCEQQQSADSNLGKITFKAFFDNLTRTLNVYVLNGVNLLPLDSSGLSDPYIKLSIKPEHLFKNAKSQKTSVQKQTLYPLFDDSFQFEIPPPDCLKSGATLVFTVYDHDRITDDDIGGEAYYDLQFVPGLTHETVQGGFATAPQIEMSLTIPTLESKAVAVMKSRRPEDLVAVHFLSSIKQKRTKLLENIEKAKQLQSK